MHVSPDLQALADHRPRLMGHCYRMLGSVVDAEDAVQETLVRAWRGLDGFDARAALGTWLHRIATNVCLTAIAQRKARVHPLQAVPCGTIHDPIESLPGETWLEPIPDAWVLSGAEGPSERLLQRERIRFALVSALQQLPPRQRAALLLTEIAGFSAQEAAETLETTPAAVRSAVQRARETLSREPGHAALPPPSPAQGRLIEAYVAAFEAYDIDALTALLAEDATLSMPPLTLWLQGPETIAQWLNGRGAGCRGSRLIPTAACGAPAFAQYRDGGDTPFALIVLDIRGDRIQGMVHFLDTQTLFPRFGVPPVLGAGRSA